MSLDKTLTSVQRNVAFFFLLTFISFGLLFSMISSYMGYTGEDNLFATLIRRLTFFLAIISIYSGFVSGVYRKYLTKASVLLIVFYGIYYFVVQYDLYNTVIADTFFKKLDKELILVRMTRLVLIPFIGSLVIRTEGFKTILLIKSVYWSLTVSLLLALFVLNISFGSIVEERLEIEGELNSLNMGYWAATLFLLIIYIYFQLQNKLRFIVYIPGLLLSLYLMLVAGSRGPIIYSIIILYYYLTSVKLTKKVKRFINVSSILIILTVLLDYTIVTDVIGIYNTDLQERLISSIEKQEASGRDVIYENALEQFNKSPIIGNYFVLQTGHYRGQYPHNILIEALITFGLLGAIPFFIFIIKTFRRTHALIKQNHEMSWLGIVFLISFFKGLSTWTLYGNSLLWMSMFIILTYKLKEIKKKI